MRNSSCLGGERRRQGGSVAGTIAATRCRDRGDAGPPPSNPPTLAEESSETTSSPRVEREKRSAHPSRAKEGRRWRARCRAPSRPRGGSSTGERRNDCRGRDREAPSERETSVDTRPK